MEDERVISLTVKLSKAKAMFLFKVLFAGIGKGYELYTDRNLGDRIFSGETEWNKFLSSIDPITIKELENNEVNLEKFKKELEKYGIGFSFYKHADGQTVSLAFYVKHKEIVEKSLSETLENIINNEDFVDKVKKKPEEKTLSEKLNYYKQEENKEKTKKEEKIKEREVAKDLNIEQKDLKEFKENTKEKTL